MLGRDWFELQRAGCCRKHLDTATQLLCTPTSQSESSGLQTMHSGTSGLVNLFRNSWRVPKPVSTEQAMSDDTFSLAGQHVTLTSSNKLTSSEPALRTETFFSPQMRRTQGLTSSKADEYQGMAAISKNVHWLKEGCTKKKENFGDIAAKIFLLPAKMKSQGLNLPFQTETSVKPN